MNPIKRFAKYITLLFLVSSLLMGYGHHASALDSTLVSRGALDDPALGSTVQGVTTVRGWFLDTSGVSKVEVYVDGKDQGSAAYGQPRSDVLTAFPLYKNGNSGYQYALDTRTLTPGNHTLTVTETGSNGGQVTLSRTMTVQNLQPRGVIDDPAQGSTVQGVTTVRGWFLDGSGVSKVEVYVDGKDQGSAAYGQPRPDVLTAFPKYQNGNSGYQYALDTRTLTPGNHTLTVMETGANGVQTTVSRTVTVQNLQPRGVIDDPAQGSTVQGVTTVRGWFLDTSGVSKVEVYVDGKDQGSATYGQPRPDVLTAFPKYQNGNSGYQYALDTRTLTPGSHTLTVTETGSNGGQVTLSRTVTVQNLQPRGVIDDPSQSSNTVQGITTVRGWFLDGSGVSKVEVYVDGKDQGSAAYGQPRPDVLTAFPKYQNGNSGYQYALDTRTLTLGNHTLTVTETGSNRVQTTLSRTISVIRGGYIDGPVNNSTIGGLTTVRGWFLDQDGVSNVEVYVDGQDQGSATLNQPRPDVNKAFPTFGSINPGYQFNLDSGQLTDGSHVLKVVETGKNGEQSIASINVTVENPYVHIDLTKPANITAQDIVNFFNANNSSSPLKNDAQNFINAQNQYGVNAQYLVAQAIWETGWGTSELYQYKHNLYGYGAFDFAPFTCGYYFPTDADSINYAASQIRSNYLNVNGSYYSAAYGPTLAGMNQYYATDPNWKNGIASIMQEIKPYDASYYQNTAGISSPSTDTATFGTDIPAGQPYPSDVMFNYPSGTTATVVNASLVNLRSLPYVSGSTLIGTVPQNTVVNVLGYNTDVSYDPGGSDNYAYRWYRVNVNGQNGWMYGQYLQLN